MWFFIIFFSFLFFFFLGMNCLVFFYISNTYICIFFFIFIFEVIARYWILGQTTLLYIFLGLFWLFCRWGFGYKCNPLSHTHTFCSLHEWGPIPGSELLRIREDCVVVPQWMYLPTGHCENLARVCLLHWYSHFLLFTNYHGKCHEVGNSSSDLDI